MTEEQQKPVIKITDHYFTDEAIIKALQYAYVSMQPFKVIKDDKGFYYRTETEI